MEFMIFSYFSRFKKYHGFGALNTFMVLMPLFLCSACSFEKAKPTSETLRVQLEREPMSLDPTFVEDGVALLILNNINDGLLGYSSSGELEPRLAEKFEKSVDGKTYEFTLRRDIKWSDGKEVTVDDFILAMKRTLAPQSNAKLTPLLFAIRGAKSFHEGQGQSLGVSQVKGRLVIELERPVPYFPHLLTLPITYPIRKDVLESHRQTWPEDAPVTGAYRILAHKLNTSLVLERNPLYWGAPAKIKNVEFKVITDESTASNAFSTGQLDIMTRVSSFEFSRLKQEGLIQTTPFLATYYIAFNCKKSPFNDVRWRRRVAGAIQKEEITQALGSGEVPASSWIPKGLEGYFAYRAEKQVKVEEGFPRSFEIAFDESFRNQRIFEIIQQNLKTQLGSEVSLSHSDWKSYIQRLQTDPPAIYRMGWMAPILDPITHLRVFLKGERNNYTGCSDARYERLVAEIQGLAPGQERSLKIIEAQKIILEDLVAVVPLYHYVQNTAVAKRVRGFEMSLFGMIAFQKISFEESTHGATK